MDKYISTYTKDQFVRAIDLLENTWTQIEFKNGLPGQIVQIFLGNATIVNNLITTSNSWQISNSDAGLTDTVYMTIPNYNKFWVRSFYNNQAQSNSCYKTQISVELGHMYYLYAVADGIIANESPLSNSYNQEFNRYGISLESSNGIIASKFVQDINVHELSCIGTVPMQEGSDFVVALYSNKDLTARDAIVYFGCVTLVDLTACFGAGNEPNIDWCNQHLKFYGSANQHPIIITNIENTNNYLQGEIDNNGSCIISTPGFGTYSMIILDNQNIVYYNNIVIDRIKRYTIDLNEI